MMTDSLSTLSACNTRAHTQGFVGPESQPGRRENALNTEGSLIGGEGEGLDQGVPPLHEYLYTSHNSGGFPHPIKQQAGWRPLSGFAQTKG